VPARRRCRRLKGDRQRFRHLIVHPQSGGEGLAEIAVQRQPFQPDQVLHQHRPVEPVVRLELGDLRLGCLVTENNTGRAVRDGAGQSEQDQADHSQGE
jgi:hypothetical protein